MSEKTLIEHLMNNLDKEGMCEFPFNAVCGDIFEGKPASENEINVKLMGFRDKYKIDHLVILNIMGPPLLRFWKIKEIKQLVEDTGGNEPCLTLNRNEEYASTAR
jgi:hypothetical protein